MSEHANPTNPKPPHLDRLSGLWRRVTDRKIVQWSVAYVALAYGIQHGVILTSESFEWPNAVARISILLLALGLPVVMTFAWYHGERASRRISGPELTIISILLVIGSLFFYVFVRPSEDIATGSAVRQAGVAAARNAAADPHGAISVAVLPFVNLSSDKEQEFFSDGMTDEITSALAKVPNLRVVGRSSAFQFKGQNRDIGAIGQALHASHVIEGSVRKAGNRVRITAQLIQAGDGLQLWTDNYDRELTDVFAIQENIAQAIAAALQIPLGLKHGENLVPNRSIDPDSYQDYLRAKTLVRARGLKPITDAAALLEQVVVRNPNYAPAWALLAHAYFLVPDYTPSSLGSSVDDLRRSAQASLPKAEAAAKRAIQLDPNLADGYFSLGAVEHARGNQIRAEDLYKQALALDANNPDALHLYGLMLAETGRERDSLAMRQRLRLLEGFVPVYNWVTASVLWLNGQNDEAVAILKDLPPNSPFFGRTTLLWVYAAMGRYRESADLLQAVNPGDMPPGIVDEAVRLLRTAPAKAVSPKSLPPLGQLSWIYFYVGAPDRVLEYYEHNVEAGYNFGLSEHSLWHSSYASLRKTERFKAHARKAGYVDYWKARGWPDLCRPQGADDFVCD